MSPRALSICTHSICLLALAGSLPAAAASPGTWTARTAGTAATASGHGAAGGARGSAATTAGAGSVVTMRVDDWSPQSELDTLKGLLAAGDTKGFLSTLGGYDHGEVVIGAARIPVDLAWNESIGGKDVVVLVSAKPFAASGARGSMSGAAVGYIRLAVDSSGSGEGAMYSTTQVSFKGSSGEPAARAGASSATKLVEVER